MLLCASAGVFLWNRLFRPVLPWRWAAVLGALALAPVLPALREGFVYGPFDTNVSNLPWATRADLDYEPKVGRLNDVTLQFTPWQAEVRRQMLAGRVPLLNPHSGAGQPLLGNATSAAFSPVSLLSLPFEPLPAQALRGFLKVLIALCGAFLAARQLGARPAFALPAAVAYAWGGSISVWKLFPQAEVLAFWPFAFLASERLLTTPGETRSRLLLGLALAGMFLAGHPETALAGCLVLAVRWLLTVRRDRRTAATLILISLLAALATSFFLLPMAQNVFLSEKFDREHGGRKEGGGSGLGALATLAVPGLFGTPQRAGEAGPGPLQWLGEGSMGLAALALAAGGLASRRAREGPRLFLILLAAVAFAIHLGPLRAVFDLPFLSIFATRYFGYLGGFAAALLAALALEDWAGGAEDRRLRRGMTAAVLLAGIAAVAAHPLAVRRWQTVDPAIVAESARHALAAGLAAAGLVAVLLLARRAPALAGLLAAALVAGQLGFAFGGYNPTVPREHAYPPLPLLAELAKAPRPFRLIGTRGVLFPSSSTFYGLSDVRTHDPMESARFVDWLHEVLDLDVSTYKKQYRTPRRGHVPYLRLLGVRFLLAGPHHRLERPWIDRGLFRETRLWELPGEVRWAFFPETVVPVATPQRAREVLLQARRPFKITSLEIGDGPATPNGRARVLGWVVDGDRLQIETAVEEEAWLVVSQAAVPGWTARTDDRPARTAIADGALVAVQVPKGTRVVSLRYRPMVWRVGLALSVTAWLAVVLLLVRRLKRSRTYTHV